MEQEKSAIRQPWLNLIHSLADDGQVTSQLAVVARPEFNGDDLLTPLHPSLPSEKKAANEARVACA